MATTQINAVGQYQACAYRVWELGDDCAIKKAGGATGAANAIVGTGIVRANMSVELKEGAEVEATTACGALAWYAKDIDRIKRWNMELEVATWDYELLGITVGGTLITAETTGGIGDNPAAWDGKTIGWAAPGPTATTQKAVALEIWARSAYSTGACSSIADAPNYVRHVFPRCQLQLSDRAFEEATPGYMKFTGRCDANPKLVEDLANAGVDDTPWSGPANPEAISGLTNSTYFQMFDNNLPTADPAFDGGYTVYTFV